MMRFASLGSGSEGNALVVEAGGTRLLLDCGFGLADTGARLGRLGLRPEQLDAVVVTHEHDDHVGGVARFARKFDLPVWLTHGTFAAAEQALSDSVRLNWIEGFAPFAIGAIEVAPFAVPHDAREPAQFVFGDGAHRLGVLTDAGGPTPHIAAALGGCDALVLECNHDLDMLEGGTYPEPLKRRIAGPLGHLDNRSAARLLAGLETGRLQHVIAAHLSKRNNRPDLAQDALAGALGCERDWVGIATQEQGFDWRQIA